MEVIYDEVLAFAIVGIIAWFIRGAVNTQTE